jgi:hypothetical protein
VRGLRGVMFDSGLGLGLESGRKGFWLGIVSELYLLSRDGV